MSTIQTATGILAVVIGGVAGYEALALGGVLGPAAQNSARGALANLGIGPANPTSTPSASAAGAYHACQGPFANSDTLKAANVNIFEQMATWQGERGSRGQDPWDWGACRTHIQAILAPDPGALPPREFCGWNGGVNYAAVNGGH